ncbi:hypothetical protein RN001_001461 [Aquatica leii]|uniref:Uncharacterized protein n=1 Tax=Aquatica leii TaxID=1421715 RepID=A0AAN7PBM4_9COLE|nr:hypothetical protein RN001_001461 [Aquatica leii]
MLKGQGLIQIIIKYLEQIIRKQNILQSTIVDVNQKLDDLKKRRTVESDKENVVLIFSVLDYLPVNSEADLHALEVYLSDEENFQNAIKTISSLGGSNCFCGAAYSYEEKRKKQPFRTLKLNELLIKALMNLFTNSTIKEIEVNKRPVYFVQGNVSLHLSLACSHRLEQEILKRFPTEKLEFYRVSKRGKIYNKYANMKPTFKSAVSGHFASSKTKSKETETQHEKNFELEDNAKSCIRCLKYDNLSVAEFDQCWKACARYRLTQIKKLASTKSIMETWPFYKAPSGYRLIDIDYKICFDGSDGLILNWKKYFDVLVKFLSSSGNVKDKKIKGLVEKVRDAPDLPENRKNAAIFWALHGNFVPTKLIVVKKDDKKINT